MSKPNFSLSTILVVVGLVWAVGQEFTEAGAYQAEATAATARANASDVELHRLELVSSRKLDSLAGVSRRSVARADSAARRAPQIVERIREVAGDSVATVAEVDKLVVNHAAETAGLRSALDAEVAAKEVVLGQLQQTVVVKDLALSAANTASAALERSERGRKRDRVIAVVLLLTALVLR